MRSRKTTIHFTMLAGLLAGCDPGAEYQIEQSVSASCSASPPNEFFQELGSNGRVCATCHVEDAGWSIAPSEIQDLFDRTQGNDPLFRTNDGSTSPLADVSTLDARRVAYALLLERGVIRIKLTVPATAEFALIAVDDPYGWASAAELSLFRRPLPTANLSFLTSINWDARRTNPAQTFEKNLADQANGAHVNHAQGAAAPLTEAMRQSIVAFELGIFHAESRSGHAQKLNQGGARGGPENLAAETFDPMNNVPGFDLYDAWAGLSGGNKREARAAIARGQALFNAPRTAGRCAGCHDMHNVGTNSSGGLFNIGVSAPARRSADVPLYTFQNLVTGEIRETTDPGRALITGKWADMDRFKTPGLRGLASRAPYFHDGSAATLDAVLEHYQTRFGFTLTAAEQADLVAFLSAL